MRVGYERQHETDTIIRFYQMMKFMLEKEETPELKAFVEKARLIVIMAMTREMQDIERGNIAKDRIMECRECRMRHDGECQKKDRPNGRCIYDTPEAKIRAIRNHFGEEGMQWAAKAGEFAERILEAKNGKTG